MTTYNGHNDASEHADERDTPVAGELPANGSNTQTLTEPEQEVVRAVSEHFAGLYLETSVVPVHTLEGTEVETLRFTLSGIASSDLHRDRITGDGAVDLAGVVVQQLRQQLPIRSDDDKEPIDAMTAAMAGPASSSSLTSQTAHDPVCHMDIKIDDAFGRSTHNGLTYYLCSENCKQRFDADPVMVLSIEEHAHAPTTV